MLDMNIGIVTVHDSANFGSFLQAFALKTALEDMGHNVYFVQTRNRKATFKVFVKRDRNIKRLIYNIKKYKIFMNELSQFKEIELSKITKDTLDLLVIGSDELWNVNTPTFRNEYFYGIGIPTQKKITYAISCGNATEENLKKYPNLIKGIKNLNKIFTRDELTRNNLKGILGIDCDFTCDPTFLVDINRMKKNYKLTFNNPYILIYSYNFSDKQKQYICRFAKENNLKIVSAGLYNTWCDINVNCSALDFSSVISNAKYIITTTFHGTIFSILNKGQFITFESSPKVQDVLDRTNLSDRIIHNNESYEEFKNKLMGKIDFKTAHENILAMRKKSLEVLKDELEENVHQS